MTTTINTAAIAETILTQLGGHRFIAMTGSKYFVPMQQGGLQFRIPRNASKANMVTITLNELDLYDVTFIKFTESKLDRKTYEFVDAKYETIKSFANVYFDQLQELFTEVTGMYTHL